MGSCKLYKAKEFIRKDEKGEVVLDESLKKIRELVVAASHHRDHNILIDIRETETRLDFSELLEVALEFAKHEDIFSNKIAFIIPDVEERIRRAEYVKKCLVGIMRFQMEYFTDYEKAIDWLSVIQEHED